MTLNEMVKIWEGMMPEQRELCAAISFASSMDWAPNRRFTELLNEIKCDDPNFTLTVQDKKDWDSMPWPFKFGQAAEHPAPEAVQ